MTISLVSRALKRFAWLWGALLGAVLLPLLTAACPYAAGSYQFPHEGMHITSSTFMILTRFAFMTRQAGMGNVWCGLMGCCGALLWTGHCSFWGRTLSIAVGASTLGCVVWNFWSDWHPSPFASGDNTSYLPFYMANAAPLSLAALLLLFFALVARSPRGQAA